MKWNHRIISSTFYIVRSGGDWSTTYAPSPFYITSRMKSLYLEGYNYSVFDLTKVDRIQIEVVEPENIHDTFNVLVACSQNHYLC